MSKDMLDYDEASAVLGLPKGTLYAMVSHRRIPHIRMGPRLVRFRREDLDKWLRTQTVLPEGEIKPSGRHRSKSMRRTRKA